MLEYLLVFFIICHSYKDHKFDLDHFKNNILRHILKVRIPGTVGHSHVKNFLINYYNSYGWSVFVDDFTQSTPFQKEMPFSNIYTVANLNATKYLALACHYDSKYFFPYKNQMFLGAIDSAVPCAIILYLTQMLTSLLDINSQLSLMIIYFDGEEAFKEWSINDSLYGSRHLSNIFSTTSLINSSSTIIQSIDLLILLDLIGYKSSQFLSLFKETEKDFEQLCQIEEKLYPYQKAPTFVSPMQFQYGYYSELIQDDHIPFVEKGVNVLHLIPIPFPPVWHTFDDNETNIDYDSVKKFTNILYQYILYKLNIY